MSDRLPVEFRIGDKVALVKAHPCGSRTWSVVRVGADIGLVCEGCAHRVMVERRRLERRLKEFVERGQEPEHRSAEGASA